MTDAPVIASKVANAQFGALWVGGRLTLSSTTLEFHPNGANRLVNSGPLDIEIDLRRVESVDVQPGVLTKIIAVRVGGTDFRARCFGAAGMADQIRTAVRAAYG